MGQKIRFSYICHISWTYPYPGCHEAWWPMFLGQKQLTNSSNLHVLQNYKHTHIIIIITINSYNSTSQGTYLIMSNYPISWINRCKYRIFTLAGSKSFVELSDMSKYMMPIYNRFFFFCVKTLLNILWTNLWYDRFVVQT